MAARFSIFAAQCPQCAASLAVSRDATAITCEYCGTSVLLQRKSDQQPTVAQPRKPRPVAKVHTSRAFSSLIAATVLVPMAIAGFVLTRDSRPTAAPTTRSTAPPTRAAVAGRVDTVTKKPDELLAAKLSAIIKCINDRVLLSRERYLSWVDVKKGPTGRERHISAGLYMVSFSGDCANVMGEAATKKPALPTIDPAAAAYAATMKKLVPTIVEASRYYGDKDYKDDAMAKGKAWHPVLLQGFASYQRDLSTLLAQLTPVADALIARETAAARAAQDMPLYWGRKSFQTALALVRISNAMNGKHIKTLDLAAFSPMVDQLIEERKQLAKSNPGRRLKSYASYVSSFLKHTKGLRRMAAKRKNFRRSQRSGLGTQRGWMIDNSPDRIRNEFRSLLRSQRQLFSGERTVTFHTTAGARLLAYRASGAVAEAMPASTSNARGTRARSLKARAKATPPAPTGPVLTVAEAKPVLTPMVLACMRKHNVYSLQTRLGNKVVGPVRLLGRRYSSRVDGRRSKITRTKIGRCINAAGKKVRARAFRSNYILLNLTNSSVPNPLANLPARAEHADAQETIDAVEPKLHACARKHGEEGATRFFAFIIDGPTGNVISVRSIHGSRAFRRCAEKVYRALRFTKVQQAQYKHTKQLRL